MREAIIIEGTDPVNVIVLPDGADGDALLSKTCVEVTGLDPKPGIGNGWQYVKGKWVEPPSQPMNHDEIRSLREMRYQAETDPMFMKVQRDEDGVTIESWKAAVDQIRADLPYPEAP